MVQTPPYELLAKPAIKSIKDLKGKVVSIGGQKDVTRIYLDRMLEPNGLKDRDVDLVYRRRILGAARRSRVGRGRCRDAYFAI